MRQMFAFDEKLLTRARRRIIKSLSNFSPTINKTRVIGIHNRRGDAATVASVGYLTADREYFEMATGFFRRRNFYNPEITVVFLVLGENFADNQRIFAGINNTIVLEPVDAAEDMCLLTLCDGAIITIGTYSWWAGFLNGGTVVASAIFAKRENPTALKNLTIDFFAPNSIVL